MKKCFIMYSNCSPFCNLSNNSIDLLTSTNKKDNCNNLSKISSNLLALIETDQNLPLANVRGSPMVAIFFDY